MRQEAEQTAESTAPNELTHQKAGEVPRLSEVFVCMLKSFYYKKLNCL